MLIIDKLAGVSSRLGCCVVGAATLRRRRSHAGNVVDPQIYRAQATVYDTADEGPPLTSSPKPQTAGRTRTPGPAVGARLHAATARLKPFAVADARRAALPDPAPPDPAGRRHLQFIRMMGVGQRADPKERLA